MKKNTIKFRDVVGSTIVQSEILALISQEINVNNTEKIDFSEFLKKYKDMGWEKSSLKFFIYNSVSILSELLFYSVWAYENNMLNLEEKMLSEFGISGKNANTTLKDFSKHLRNAIAHSNFEFFKNGNIRIWDCSKKEIGICTQCQQKILSNKYEKNFEETFTHYQFLLIAIYFKNNAMKILFNQ